MTCRQRVQIENPAVLGAAAALDTASLLQLVQIATVFERSIARAAASWVCVTPGFWQMTQSTE